MRIKDKSAKIRGLIIDILFSIDHDNYETDLIEIINCDPSPNIRKKVLDSFSIELGKKEPNPAISTAIVSRIKDTDVSIRISASKLFYRINPNNVAINVLQNSVFSAICDVNSVRDCFIESLCNLLEENGLIKLNHFIYLLSPSVNFDQCKKLIFEILDFIQLKHEDLPSQSFPLSQDSKMLSIDMPKNPLNEIDSFILLAINQRERDLFIATISDIDINQSTISSQNDNSCKSILASLKSSKPEFNSIFALENFLHILAIENWKITLTKPLAESKIQFAESILTSSFGMSSVISVAMKIIFDSFNNPTLFNEKIREIVSDLCEPLEEKDKETVYSENSQSLNYLDQKIAMYEKKRFSTLTSFELIEYLLLSVSCI